MIIFFVLFFMMIKILILSSLVITLVSADCKQWKNPIISFESPDPWFTYQNGSYYYSRSDGRIHIYKSSFLSNWEHAIDKVVWSAPPNTPYSKE